MPVVIELEYGGNDVEVDIEADTAKIEDIDEGMRKISALYAWYGVLYASERRKADDLDAAYRSWRSVLTEDQLAKDGKTAEWKVKNYVEAQPKFKQFKHTINLHEFNASALLGAMQALQMKGEMLRSLGARDRVELGATNMTTRAEERPKVTSKRPQKTNSEE